MSVGGVLNRTRGERDELSELGEQAPPADATPGRARESHSRSSASLPSGHGDVIRHTGSNRGENLHGKAWNMADVEVLLMRATPGTPEHARSSERAKASSRGEASDTTDERR